MTRTPSASKRALTRRVVSAVGARMPRSGYGTPIAVHLNTPNL